MDDGIARAHPRGAISLSPLRVGIWGTFRVENYGDVVIPMVTRRALQRRLPAATIDFFDPTDPEQPAHFAAPLGRVTALGEWSEPRRTELGGELDAVVIGGGEIVHWQFEQFAHVFRVPPETFSQETPVRFFVEALGEEQPSDRPVAWNAVGVQSPPDEGSARVLREALARYVYVSVRDPLSRDRLRAIGVERSIEVVPDPGFLLPELIPRSQMLQHVEWLRRRGWYPRSPAIVVQGNGSMLGEVPKIARALEAVLARTPDAQLVSVRTGMCHDDDAFASALAEALPIHWSLPPEATVTDITAAIAGSAAFVGSSLHGNIVAFAYGRPSVVVNTQSFDKLNGFAAVAERPDAVITDVSDLDDALARAMSDLPDPDAVASLQERLHAHFDRLTERISAGSDRPADELGTAIAAMAHRDEIHERSNERLLESLARDAASARADAQDLQVALTAAREAADELRVRGDDAEQEVLRLRGELDALEATKLFRWSASARRLWSRIRRRRGPRS